MILESNDHKQVTDMDYDELEDEWNSLQSALDAADLLLCFCNTTYERESLEVLQMRLQDRHTDVDEYWAEMEWEREANSSETL